jgi:hypothetical protein
MIYDFRKVKSFGEMPSEPDRVESVHDFCFSEDRFCGFRTGIEASFAQNLAN